MLQDDIAEAVDVLGRVLGALLVTLPRQKGRPGADLRRAVGDLMADRESAIRAGSLAAPLQKCFEFGRLAGATAASFAQVRATIVAESPRSIVAGLVVDGALRLCLAQEARIIASRVFASRDEIDALIASMNIGFGAAEEAAADARDAANYQSLVALHAAVTRHLLDRGRPLPRLITRTFATPIPALTLANRIYGDASRTDELLADNRPVHPLFMAGPIRALSA